MKIVNTVYGDASGGRWQAMLNTHDALASQGHQMWIVAGDENRHLSTGNRQFFALNSSGFYDVWAAWRLNFWLRKERPDFIIAHSGRAVYLFKNAMLLGGIKIPVLAMNHSHNVKRTLRADGFIHITPHVGECVAQAAKCKGIDLTKKPQTVISNLIHLPDDSPSFSETVGQPVVLGIMTRLVEYKGTHLAISAVEQLKKQKYKVKLLIAGDGEQKEALIQQVKDLNLENEVNFLGWINGEDKRKFYKDIDIALVPTMNDTQPLAILDAFAWGKPVVASDHISVQQIIRHGENGYMVKQNDIKSLAEKISYLIDHPENLKLIAIEGYKDVIQKYQFSKIAEKLNAFVSR
ncbi:glycosyltransferase family 4 protein [Acinetobacter sp. ANC 4173]|uniref:glycosyltransferase family 4 protein n=1 Tax=Acinetobacter sp. ANC 4173 TaxID=2529837 RepID=UPI00103968AE|nr:glycosyltransferase family 4 protein [Acinetobacter sp. ANC 4173]TCB79903.1 glycosyltransferase family 1 protein [Acinetobacter sp. ANC 4173]